VTANRDVTACVLGDMDLLRPLVLAGVGCAIVARPGSPASYSRFGAPAVEWVDHWSDPGLLVDRLVEFGRAQPSPPVLFYQSTGDLLMISRNRERLSEAFRFVITNAELVEDLTDKARFHDLAERLGLPVPATRFLNPADDPHGWRLDSGFPLLLKPVVREFAKWRKVAPDSKAVTVHGNAELEELWPRLATANVAILAQELIPGPESRIESYHTYIDESGRVVAEFAGRKIRTRPAEFGYSTAVALTDAADVIEVGRGVARRLGITGVAKLDFKRAPDGKLLLLEVNPRFTLWHHPAAVGGLNIPALVFADLTGGDRPPTARARAGVRWCDPWEDAGAARESGELDARWVLDTIRCDAKSGFSWDDPMPLLRGVVAPRVRTRARRRLGRHRAGRSRAEV